MTVRVSWARCPECGQYAPSNGRSFTYHTLADGLTICGGVGSDARSAIAAVIRSDMKHFESEVEDQRGRIADARKVIRERTAWIKSARKQLAELEKEQ